MENKKLIVLEGISGAGKSTNIQLLTSNERKIDGINIKISKLMENIDLCTKIIYN